MPELPITSDVFLLLVTTSFIASMLTASVGIGGGTLVLAVLVVTVPIAAVVPLHSVVQLGSNTGRAMMTRPHVSMRLFWPLVIGALIGTLQLLPLALFGSMRYSSPCYSRVLRCWSPGYPSQP